MISPEVLTTSAAQFRRLAERCLPSGEGQQAFLFCAEQLEVLALGPHVGETTPLPRWEYTSAEFVDWDDLGLQGWELVAVVLVVTGQDADRGDYSLGYFKRPLSPTVETR